jgi:hypothetical protein
MICLRCPKCRKVLSVNESNRGGIGQCPDCGQQFRIPAAAPQPVAAPAPVPVEPPAPPPQPLPGPRPAIHVDPPIPPPAGRRPQLDHENLPLLPIGPDPDASSPHHAGYPDFELSAPPEPATPMVKFHAHQPAEEEYEVLQLDEGGPPEEPAYDVVAEVVPSPIPMSEAPAAIQEPHPVAIPVEPLAEDPLDAVPVGPKRSRSDDYDDYDRPRRRRRRRRRQSGLGFQLPTQLIPGISNFMALLVLLGAIWLLLGGVALLAPPLGVFLVLLGILLSTVGRVWFLVIAFQDDLMTGLLCLLVPLYDIIYLINNQDSAGPPFLVNLIGIMMAFSGIWLVGGLGG